MARVECRSAQPDVPLVFVEIDSITDEQVSIARQRLNEYLKGGGQSSTAVAHAFLNVAAACPHANPSDLWQHVIYRHLLESGWNDQKRKRVSGFALERAFVELYKTRLAPYGIRMHILPKKDANRLLLELGIKDTRSNKVDLFVQGNHGDEWLVFGAVHVKSSIAERIQDDVPASQAFIEIHPSEISDIGEGHFRFQFQPIRADPNKEDW